MQQQSMPPPTITTTETTTRVRVKDYDTWMLWVMISILPSIIFSFGAAKLSYDKFRSLGWAILAFIFSAVYYPYYAFTQSGPAPATTMGSMVAAGRRLIR